MKTKDINKMNIVHINLSSPFMDNSGYQEAMLAKCHKIICNNVTIINNNQVLHDDGSVTLCEPSEYFNYDGVKIIRMRLYDSKARRHIDINGLYSILCNEKPDFIMIHEVFLFDVYAVAKYYKMKNKHCIIVADSHATIDNANIMDQNLKNIFFRTLLKVFNRYMSKYYSKVYGIVDDAVDLMVKYAGIPRNKTAVLGLGFDETLIDFDNQDKIRKSTRQHYDIPQNVRLFVHGGKLNEAKKTDAIISAMLEMPADVWLVVFGEYSSDSYKIENESIAKKLNGRVVFTGQLDQKEIYNVFLSSDVAIFPGSSSCLRQQAAATGLPIVICNNKADKGINININGNAYVLDEKWKESELVSAMKSILNDDIYHAKARELCCGYYKQFSYMRQAKSLIVDNMSHVND